MVFTKNELTFLFKNVPHVGLASHTRGLLDKEGLIRMEYLKEFKSDQLYKVINNICMYITGIPA